MSKHRKPVTQSNAVFATASIGKIQRSTFIRPSSLKTTFNCGKLVPIYVDEILPGDDFDVDLRAIARLSTPLFPTMDDIDLEFFAMYAPSRILWNGWTALHGENLTGAWVPESDPALVPVFGADMTGSGSFTSIQSKSLGDYMGLPVGLDVSRCPVSALPFRMYAMVYNEWFRDENLQAPVPILLGNTESYDSINSYGPCADLFSVNKFHDYFTSALPAPLKGESPLIPVELNKLIPVVTGDVHNKSFPIIGNAEVLKWLGNDITSTDVDAGVYNHYLRIPTHESGTIPEATSRADFTTDSGVGTSGLKGVLPVNLWADPRGINMASTTISEIRTLFQIQKLLERDSRSGTRFRELLLAHFSVDAGDYRLQRPEFLGKYVTRVGIQAVPQTSSTDSTSPQGNLAAYSYSSCSTKLCKKSFVEHGYLMIFAVARQVKTYQQGVERFWSRRERFDFYYPSLAHISEQPIYNKEIYAFLDTVNGVPTWLGNDVFGYQEAWADYRYKPNRVTGQMRSGVTNSLDTWHYADYYSSTPVLSAEWVTDNSDVNVDRTLAVKKSHDDQIRMDVAFVCKATRPMPLKSIPGLVDHF